jgi:LPXTG-site transpeptidase (sortase) family protein
VAKTLKIISALLVFLGIVILLLVFGPLIKQEVIFQYNKLIGTTYYIYNNQELGNRLEGKGSIIPKSTDFGIVIPKIDANASIFANIDPFNENEFLPILKKGVAHAKGTSFPGHGGNIFLFAHSASGILEIQQYNAVFYLVNKLEKDDQIIIYYKETPYYYYVFEKKIVSPGATSYLEKTEKEELTLQTCYPPGTTLKRLIIRAKLEKSP